MNRFVKAIAVAATLFAGVAQAADLDLTLITDADSAIELATAEFAAANTIAADGNAAFIVQSAADGQAYINQTGATNFAVIVQQVDASVAVILQSGDNNRALIVQ
jgi:hypothetical protein